MEQGFWLAIATRLPEHLFFRGIEVDPAEWSIERNGVDSRNPSQRWKTRSGYTLNTLQIQVWDSYALNSVDQNVPHF